MPETLEGECCWRAIEACTYQLRWSFGGIAGIDFTAFLTMGDALGVPRDLIAEILPDIERIALFAFKADT